MSQEDGAADELTYWEPDEVSISDASSDFEIASAAEEDSKSNPYSVQNLYHNPDESAKEDGGSGSPSGSSAEEPQSDGKPAVDDSFRPTKDKPKTDTSGVNANGTPKKKPPVPYPVTPPKKATPISYAGGKSKSKPTQAKAKSTKSDTQTKQSAGKAVKNGGIRWYQADPDVGAPLPKSSQYECFGGKVDAFPKFEEWISFNDMFNLNRPIILEKNKGNKAVVKALHDAIIEASEEIKVDARIILALIMQEVGS